MGRNRGVEAAFNHGKVGKILGQSGQGKLFFYHGQIAGRAGEPFGKGLAMTVLKKIQVIFHLVIHGEGEIVGFRLFLRVEQGKHIPGAEL